MRRYHFHAYGPDRTVPDYRGEYLDDMMVVRDLAFATVRHLARDPLKPTTHRRWRVEVADQDGRTVLIVPFLWALATAACRAGAAQRTHA